MMAMKDQVSDQEECTQQMMYRLNSVCRTTQRFEKAAYGDARSVLCAFNTRKWLYIFI